MSDWFTIDRIDDSTYCISEYGHWEQMHSYLLLGKTHGLLIDSGLGIGNIKSVVDKITNLPILVIVTHAHWDHIGGLGEFKDIAIHESDANWLVNGLPIPLDIIKKSVMGNSFSADPPKEFNIDTYSVYTGKPTRILLDNDIINIGLRKIQVLHTPGHSPGHICLWEEDSGYLFTGDLIYKGTLYAFYPSTDPLKFFESIKRIHNLPNIKRILPSHYDLNIEADFIQNVKEAFELLNKRNGLKQGSGCFDFKKFKIHI
jgi:glyoxylase-like metal-dependent hydrolase (beta-lactamase superfamily II)